MMRLVFIQSLSDTEESLAPLRPKVAESFFYALISLVQHKQIVFLCEHFENVIQMRVN